MASGGPGKFGGGLAKHEMNLKDLRLRASRYAAPATKLHLFSARSDGPTEKRLSAKDWRGAAAPEFAPMAEQAFCRMHHCRLKRARYAATLHEQVAPLPSAPPLLATRFP